MTTTRPVDDAEHVQAPASLVEADATPELSVVVITKNEADRVRDCIESIFDAADGVAPFEVVLVDSASTDETIELAREYPVTILRIPEEHVVSCGAGRFVGDAVGRGDRVLHVDGDMELSEDWLRKAYDYLDEHDDVVGVEGCLNESQHDDVVDVDKVGGVMLFERDALEDAGGFAPYLRSYEDIDVGYRLTAAGHRLVRLPDVSASHPEWESVLEPFRRWRAGYYHGVGQTIRYDADSPRVLWLLVKRQRFKFALLAWFAVGALSSRDRKRLLAWTTASVLGFGVVASKLGVRGATQFFLSKALGSLGAVLGSRDPADPPESYPLDEIEVVQPGRMADDHVRSNLQ